MSLKMRYKVYKGDLQTATFLGGFRVVTCEGKTETQYEHCMGRIPKFALKLRMWGKAGVVKYRSKINTKIGYCKVTCVFVGNDTNYGDDVYRMWNPDTNRIHITRDIIWLKRMFYQDKLTTGMVACVTHFDDSDIDEIGVGGKEVNDCDVIGNPNVSDDKNENKI